MQIISHDEIVGSKVSFKECYGWVDYIVRNFNEFILPTKTRVPLKGSDYFNIMPCVLPNQNAMGVKVVTRNSKRHEVGDLNIDAQIFLYSYDTEELVAVLDGNWITTVRTAMIAVHSLLNISPKFDTVAMIGLGNIGATICDILFELCVGRKMTIKLYRYKDHAERIIDKYKNFDNLTFIVCDTYYDLMKDSDVVFSSVNYVEKDFCDANVYKNGCTVIPVHMRGFMECDKLFDHVITSDLESIKKFKNYDEMKRISLINDVLNDKVNIRYNPGERILIYNLGIALYDIYFANEIYRLLNSHRCDIRISPSEKKYV